MASDTFISALLGAGQAYRSSQEMRLSELLREIQRKQEQQEWVQKQEFLDKQALARDETLYGREKSRAAESAYSEMQAHPKLFKAAQDNLKLPLTPENAPAYTNWMNSRIERREKKKELRDAANFRTPESIVPSLQPELSDEENAALIFPKWNEAGPKRKERMLSKVRRARLIYDSREREEKQAFDRQVTLTEARAGGSLGGTEGVMFRSAIGEYQRSYLRHQKDAAKLVASSVVDTLIKVNQMQAAGEMGTTIDSLYGDGRAGVIFGLKSALAAFVGEGAAEDAYNKDFEQFTRLADSILNKYEMATRVSGFEGFDPEDMEEAIISLITDYPLFTSGLTRYAKIQALNETAERYPPYAQFLFTEMGGADLTSAVPQAETIDEDIYGEEGIEGDELSSLGVK